MTDLSNKEQIDMVKTWWKDYGRSLALALGLGLAITGGWRYWQHHQQLRAETASALYSEMRDVNEAQPKQAAAVAAELRQQYPKSPYAAMAAFWQAKDEIAANKPEAALSSLTWVVDHGRLVSFRQIARIRAARVLLFLKQPAAALAMLAKEDDATFAPLVEQVRAHIYRAQGNEAAAQKAFAAAKAGYAKLDVQSPLLALEMAQ